MTSVSMVPLRSDKLGLLPSLLAAAAIAVPDLCHAFHTTFDNSATRFAPDCVSNRPETKLRCRR